MKTRTWLRRGIVLAGAAFMLTVSLVSGCTDATVPRIPTSHDSTSDTTISTG